MMHQPEHMQDDASSGFSNPATRQSVRHFAGRIAHDFNNLLTPLLAYPSLIRSDLAEGSTSRNLIDVLEETAETMAHVSSRLVSLAMIRRSGPHPVSLDRVVSEVLSELAHESLALGISIVPLLQQGCESSISHDSLSGALREICINALESMDGRGVLTVKTELMTYSDPVAVVGGKLPAGEYASVCVNDTGPGMSAEVRERAFEPFFSSGNKSKARGTGLGLPIALGAVNDGGGGLLLAAPDADCFSVSILLPLVLQEDARATVEEPSPETHDAEHRILVVDDEAPILELFKIMLEAELPNATVDVACDGEMALEVFEQKRHHVIVMDLHMPIMDGPTAFSRLTALCESRGWKIPGVVFCSGYAPSNGIQSAVAGTPDHELLNKPVPKAVLIEAVKSRLPNKS